MTTAPHDQDQARPTDDDPPDWRRSGLAAAAARARARARRRDARERLLERLRLDGPWLLRDTIRVVLTITLAAVSAVYLTRWALLNHFPVALSWSVPLAVDAAALLAIVVHTHPRDDRARRSSLKLAWGAGGLSVAGNALMHAHDFGLLEPTVWSVMASGAVIPLMLVWSYHVASGMAPRPTDRAAAADARRAQRAARAVTRRVPIAAPSAPPASTPVDVEGADIAVPGPTARPGDGAHARPEPAGAELELMVAWALRNRQTSGPYAGNPAGKKAIAKEFPAASDRQARNAMEEARRRADAEAARGADAAPAREAVPLHVVGGTE